MPDHVSPLPVSPPVSPPVNPLRVSLLQTVRLKGRAGLDDVAAALGDPDVGRVRAGLERLAAEGACEQHGTRFRLTPSGRSALEDELRAERDALDPQRRAGLHEAFVPLNGEFKRIVHDWQLLDGTTPNRHLDPAHDARVIARLGGLHQRLMPFMTSLVGLVPRLSGYPGRFCRAFDRVRSGDHPWLANPVIDSYHTVWFELHEELLGLAGLSRTDEAAAGRAE